VPFVVAAIVATKIPAATATDLLNFLRTIATQEIANTSTIGRNQNVEKKAQKRADNVSLCRINWIDKLKQKLASLWLLLQVSLKKYGQTEAKKEKILAAFKADPDVQSLISVADLNALHIGTIQATKNMMLSDIRSNAQVNNDNGLFGW
jgi:hypothetical protein